MNPKRKANVGPRDCGNLIVMRGSFEEVDESLQLGGRTHGLADQSRASQVRVRRR